MVGLLPGAEAAQPVAGEEVLVGLLGVLVLLEGRHRLLQELRGRRRGRAEPAGGGEGGEGVLG